MRHRRVICCCNLKYTSIFPWNINTRITSSATEKWSRMCWSSTSCQCKPQYGQNMTCRRLFYSRKCRKTSPLCARRPTSCKTSWIIADVRIKTLCIRLSENGSWILIQAVKYVAVPDAEHFPAEMPASKSYDGNEWSEDWIMIFRTLHSKMWL